MEVLRFLLLSALLLMPVPSIFPCSCGTTADVCNWAKAYSTPSDGTSPGSDRVVFVAEVLEGTGERHFDIAEPPAKVRVLEVFKGVKSGEEVLSVNPSLGTSCSFRMRAGQRWLLIGSRHGDEDLSKNPADIYISGCSHSFRIDGNERLLAAIRNSIQSDREALVGKVLIAKKRNGVDTSRVGAGIRVAIANGAVVHHATTTADGEFEFPTVSPGTWTLRVTDPGFVLDSLWPASAATVRPGRCAQQDVLVFPNGSVEGTITDNNGLPVAEIDVQAFVPTHRSPIDHNPLRTARTDAHGAYKLSGLPEGEIYIAVNGEEFHDKHPRVPVFYPGVPTREHAKPILLAEGAARTGINLTVGPPRVATRIIVEATFEDGVRPKSCSVTLVDDLGRVRASAPPGSINSEVKWPLVLTAYAGQQYLVKASVYGRSGNPPRHQDYIAELVVNPTASNEQRVHLVLRAKQSP